MNASSNGSLSYALEKLLEDIGCEEIIYDEDSALSRIWIICATFGVLVLIFIIIPIFWCPKPPTAVLETAEDIAQGNDILEAETNPEPNLQAAREHLKKTSPIKNGKYRSVLFTRLSEIGAFGGPGTELYFRLLIWLGSIFAFISIMHFPLLIFNSYGTYAPDTGSRYTKTTSGNLGVETTPGDSAGRKVVVDCQAIEITKFTVTFGWLDFFGVAGFFAFACFFYFRLVPDTARRSDAVKVTARDYAIELNNLPRRIADHANYEALLIKHLQDRIQEVRSKRTMFQKLMSKQAEPEPVKVVEVSLVRDYGKRLSKIEERAKLLQKKEIAEYKRNESQVEKIEKQVEKRTKKISPEALKAEEELPVVRAYVIFNTARDAEHILHKYRMSVYALFRLGQHVPNYKHLRFQGKAIRITPAPEPSDIIWTNQDYGSFELWVRYFLGILATFVVLVISLVLIFMISQAAKDQADIAATRTGSGSCDKGLHTDESYVCNRFEVILWNTTQARAATGPALECYCTTQGYQKVVQSTELRTEICEDWLIAGATGASMAFVAAFLITAINVMLEVVLVFITQREKPVSKSSFTSKVMTKVFVAKTVNTGLIVFFVNYNGLVIFNGNYSDFVVGWYATVGTAIITNMIMNSFVPSMILVGKVWLQKVKRCFCRNQKKHQVELLRLYTNKPFPIQLRYAALLTTAYVTMMYNAGLPLLNFLGLAYCIIAYWCDKYVLLRGSHRPPAYDTSMPKVAGGILLYAGAVHCVFAIMMYGEACTFPSNPLGGRIAGLLDEANSTATAEGGSSASQATDSDFFAKATRESTWMLFALLIVLIGLQGVWIVMLLLGGTVGELWSIFKTMCCSKVRSSKVEPSPTDVADHLDFDQAKPHILATSPPASYLMEYSPEFRPLMKYLRRDLGATGDSFNPGGTSGSAAGSAAVPAAEAAADIHGEESSGAPDAEDEPRNDQAVLESP